MSQEKEAKLNLSLIQKLNISSNSEHIIFENVSEGGHGIIELPPLKGKISNRYYAVNKDHPLGVGGYGTVYEAKEINPQTGEFIKDAKPLAVKIFHSKADADKQEIVNIQGRYFRNTQLIEDTQHTVLVTELLQGQDLGKFIKTKEFSDLSYEQRIELVQQILLALNIIHSETPTTGEGLMHNDIKLDNIMMFLEKDDKTGKIKINAHIIDLGLASAKTKMEATQNNDILMLGYLIPVLIRGSVGVISADIQNLVTKFSSRMTASYKKGQPDSDECLRFITEVTKFSQLQQLHQETKVLSEKRALENDLNICQAKLELLVNGHWAQEIGTRSIEKWTDLENTDFTAGPVSTETVQTIQTVGNFLESYSEMAPMVADLYKSYGKNEWFSGFLQKMAEFLDAYPKMEMCIAEAYEKNKENITLLLAITRARCDFSLRCCKIAYSGTV